jgi:hypothetical protein
MLSEYRILIVVLRRSNHGTCSEAKKSKSQCTYVFSTLFLSSVDFWIARAGDERNLFNSVVVKIKKKRERPREKRHASRWHNNGLDSSASG